MSQGEKSQGEMSQGEMSLREKCRTIDGHSSNITLLKGQEHPLARYHELQIPTYIDIQLGLASIPAIQKQNKLIS